MNTLKRERIIKNLYDLQQLDSWEDSEHYMDCIECVRTQFAIKWRCIDEMKDEILESYRENYFSLFPSMLMDKVYEDTRYSLLRKYDSISELFKEETNCEMAFDKFRTLCLEYMDFSHLI